VAYTVNILAWAKEDIAEKIRYLKKEWGTAAARTAYNELMDKLELLATQPFMGTTIDELVQLGRSDFRLLTIERHTKVLYRADEDMQTVVIYLVFGSRQCFQDLLYKRVIRYL
jgi:plasmid stabilization system protein ParE